MCQASEGMCVSFMALSSHTETQTVPWKNGWVGLVYGLRSDGQVVGLFARFPCGPNVGRHPAVRCPLWARWDGVEAVVSAGRKAEPWQLLEKHLQIQSGGSVALPCHVSPWEPCHWGRSKG